MPVSIAERLREIGARIEPAGTAEIYAPLHRSAADAGLRIVRDQAYGTHERHVLDVFAPADDVQAMRPVLVFVHGGGFSRGAKCLPDSPFYDNVMRWAASQGLIGVNINYCLAPSSMWPSGIEDVSAVVAWIAANIESHGGNSSRIIFWGHSAGAAHVTDYIASRTSSGQSCELAGAVLTSGFYDLGDEASTWSSYYGHDVSRYAEISSLPALARASVPLLVNDAELDPEIFRVQAAALVAARRAAGTPVDYLRLLGHSHISETYAVGTDDTTLSGEVLRFIDQVRRPQ